VHGKSETSAPDTPGESLNEKDRKGAKKTKAGSTSIIVINLSCRGDGPEGKRFPGKRHFTGEDYVTMQVAK